MTASINADIKKFSLRSSPADIQNYYQAHGYVVIEALIDHARIDKFIDEYEKIKRNPFFVYHSQSVHLAIKPKVTPEGFIEESMENGTDLTFFPNFSQSILECLTATGIENALGALSGAPSHSLWQNMFFDKSTGTIEHQDHYYLDTNPPGALIGAWYALEDIHPDAGCFFVLPGSHKGEVIERKVEGRFGDHEEMRTRILELVRAGTYETKAFPLNKGDVLLWHPNTIHGAHSNRNPRYSRKSFTAHFYPSHLPRSDGRTEPLKPSSNPQILVKSDVKAMRDRSIELYKRYLSNLFKAQTPFMDMRRKSYTDSPK